MSHKVHSAPANRGDTAHGRSGGPKVGKNVILSPSPRLRVNSAKNLSECEQGFFVSPPQYLPLHRLPPFHLSTRHGGVPRKCSGPLLLNHEGHEPHLLPLF